MGYVILLWHSLSLPYNYFAEGMVGVVPLAQEDLWKLSSDKREVFFLFIAIYCLISTQTYCNQRVKIAGL